MPHSDHGRSGATLYSIFLYTTSTRSSFAISIRKSGFSRAFSISFRTLTPVCTMLLLIIASIVFSTSISSFDSDVFIIFVFKLMNFSSTLPSHLSNVKLEITFSLSLTKEKTCRSRFFIVPSSLFRPLF